jgi:hypothetical protein
MKYALIIGNNTYDDPKLAQLKTPAADSHALAKVLDDKAIGSFDEVIPLINQTETHVRRAISTFLTNKKPDDLVLFYFSGHGVLDDRGRLYLALRDTQVDLLKATSIPSSFIADEMDSCRSKRQILILDCCHSGAFARGTKGDQKAITETTFEGSGFGRVVLTASASTQYALEGDQVIKQTELSLFTHFLLEGLRTGEADMNNDGQIALDEWYDYTYARVIAETPRQVPHKWSYNQQGDLIIARNPNVKKRVVELPYELLQALESSFGGIRESAVNELGKYLRVRDPEMVELAIASLEKMKEDDSRRISLLAEKLISEFKQTRIPASKEIVSKPLIEAEPESAVMRSDISVSPRKLAAEMESPSMAGATPSRPVIERIPKSQELVFNGTLWSKWIGTAILGIVGSILLYYSSGNSEDAIIFIRTFAFIVTGLVGLAQWFFFRKQLEMWWIGVNAATGLVFGFLHSYLYQEHSEWGHESVGILLAVWVVGNFVLGFFLIRNSKADSQKLPAIVEAGAQQNIFLMLLSVSLILGSISNILLTLDSYDLVRPIWILYGISAILTSIAFILKKGTPRNFGFVSLAIFMFLDGINVEGIAFNSSYRLYYFTASDLMALLAGIFFISQKETWKNFGFILLASYLIANGTAGMSVYNSELNITFLMISVFFAVPAAIFFFLRK